MMKPLFVSVALCQVLTPLSAYAQLVPVPEAEPTVCPDRPSEPLIIQNMDFREADRVTLLKRMYGAFSLRKIVDTGDCSCEKRFPAWDEVVGYYLENYADIEDRWEISNATRPYGQSISRDRPAAREICAQQGNWG